MSFQEKKINSVSTHLSWCKTSCFLALFLRIIWVYRQHIYHKSAAEYLLDSISYNYYFNNQEVMQYVPISHTETSFIQIGCIILDLVKVRGLWLMGTYAVITFWLTYEVCAWMPNNASWFNLPSLVTVWSTSLFGAVIRFAQSHSAALGLTLTCGVFCQGLAGYGRRRLLQGVCGGGGGCAGAGVACHVGWRVRWAVVILSILPLTESRITVVVLLWETDGTLVDSKTELFEH